MNYTISFPPNYQKVALPGLNDITAALRSGKYEQGKGTLRNGDKFCCLGVISHLQNRLTEWSGCYCDINKSACGILSNTNPLFSILGNYGDLPNGVGVASSAYGVSGTTNLMLLNDTGFSFAEIADIMEEVFASPSDGAK